MAFKTFLMAGAAALALAACGDDIADNAANGDVNASENAQMDAQNGAEMAQKPAVSDEEQAARAAFDDTVQQITVEMFRESPETGTYLGLPEEMMGGPYNDHWGDYGPEGDDKARAMAADFAARLDAVDPQPLNHERRLTRKLLLDQINSGLAASQIAAYGTGGSGFSVYPVTQLSGPHINMPNLLQAQQPVNDAQGAEDYLSRLADMPRVMDETIALVQRDADLGSVPPDFVLDKTMAVLKRFTDPAPAENILYTAFAEKLDKAGIEDTQSYLDRAETTITDSVYPAYDRLAEALGKLRETAVHEASVSRLPDGDALYQALIRINADEAKLTGEDIHEIGLSEVGRIHAEMETLFADVGMTEGTIGERIEAISTDPQFLYPDNDEGKAEVIADLNTQIDEIRPLLPEYFGTIPPQELEIRRVPEFSEESAPGGYYDLPSLDGSRPGIYWINLRTTAIWPEWSLKTLTYHEGIPGHHFQLSVNLNNQDTPLLRKLTGSTNAFAEGWALYAERLAKEMGLYEGDPYGDLGRLQSELFRAARLVVDTGIHAKGWSREEAIDYMVDSGAVTDRSDAVVEIERYVVWPGQALGYKMGMLKILEMRQKAKETLGGKFDIRKFHDKLLVEGGLPLTVMESEINKWIAEQQTGSGDNDAG